MAYTPGNLIQMASGNGFATYRYDTLDAATDVDTDGYFNNVDDTLILRVGDLIDVVVWATAVRTGTIADISRHVVTAVNATTGSVNLSNDFATVTLANTD